MLVCWLFIFRGSNAAASLKHLDDAPRRRLPGLIFRGSNAAASLKPHDLTDNAVVGDVIFRGSNAAASLKPRLSPCSTTRRA